MLATALHLAPDADTLLPEVHGDRLELDVTFDALAPATSDIGLIVRRSPDGDEETRIVYDRTRQMLIVDRERSRADGLPDGWGDPRYENPLILDPGEALHLNVFLDCSVIEVVASERVMVTARVYPTRDDSLGVAAFARGGSAQVAVRCWELG